MKEYKKTYTAIYHSKDKIIYNKRNIRIILLSNVKIFGHYKNNYQMAWVYDSKKYNNLSSGDVIKFTASISKLSSSLKYVDGKNKKEIEQYKSYPRFAYLTDLIHLKDETDNLHIKRRRCITCGTLIYHKEKGNKCIECRRHADKCKNAKAYKKSHSDRKTKTCRVCGNTYPKVTHFVNRKGSLDGYASTCINCTNAKRLQRQRQKYINQ